MFGMLTVRSPSPGTYPIMTKTILVIEDDYYLSRLYQRTLSHAGFSITMIEDATQGLRAARDHTPDLILLDIIMPKMNGIDVLKQLKEEKTTKNIPVIMLSNLEQDDLIEKSLKMGANGYWVKVVMPPKDLILYVQEFFKKNKTSHRTVRPKSIIHPRHFYPKQENASAGVED